MSNENTVRDCKTDDIMAHKVMNRSLTLQHFSNIQFKPTQLESAELRKKSFQKIFDTRAWEGAGKNLSILLRMRLEVNRLIIYRTLL